MRALWLENVGTPLQLVERPDPAPGPSGVVVTVEAVRVPSYTRKVFDGSLGYDLPTPLIPGPACIGKVESVGEDVFDLSPGQFVLCNSLLSSADLVGSSDEILIGWTGSGTDRSRRMQEAWRNGSFAQKAVYPARCLTPLPGAEGYDIDRLPFLASLAIAGGGLNRCGPVEGQSIIVNGATGQLGSAAILIALARGAGRIVATGRNPTRLQALARLSPRIIPHALSGEVEADAQALRDHCEGGADQLIDFLGPVPEATATKTGIESLKTGGTAVLVGGVQGELSLSYGDIMRRQLTLRGSFMFDRSTALACWNLVRSGAIDLSCLDPRAFALERVEEAMAQAEALSGFSYVLLRPGMA